MKKYAYYRVSASECWHDGESWCVNQWHEQAAIIAISDDATDASIIRALRRLGMIGKSIRGPFSIDGERGCDLYVERWYAGNREPLMLRLDHIDPERVEHECRSRYGFPGHCRMTETRFAR
jgi:hypothetical protein